MVRPVSSRGERLCERYVVEEFLGAGAHGFCVRALDELMAIRVVCKVAHDPWDISFSDFTQQYEKIVGIRVPDFVAARGFDVDHHDGERFPVAVLEYVDGQTLDKWATGQLDIPRARALGQVATVLAELHRVGVKHGDLRGDNIIVDGERVVLIDPLPDYGSVSGTGTPSSGSVTDCEFLADLITELLPRLAASELAPVVRGLRDTTSLAVRPLDAAQLLFRTARMPPFDPSNLRERGAAFMTQLHEDASTFVKVRDQRHLAIKTLVEEIREVARHYQIEPIHDIQNVEQEEHSLNRNGSGFLAQHRIQLVSPRHENEIWTIVFEPASDFTKPWPQEPGLLAWGWSNVARQGGLGSGRIALRVWLKGNGVHIISDVTQGMRRQEETETVEKRVDKEWIAENINLLLASA